MCSVNRNNLTTVHNTSKIIFNIILDKKTDRKEAMMYITRHAEETIRKMAKQFGAVLVT